MNSPAHAVHEVTALHGDAEPRSQQMPAPFGPGSIMWEETGDVLFMALTLPAFMLQVMHPAISAGVDQHSVFRSDPIGRAIRSTDSVMLWVYGGQAAIEEGYRLRQLHKPIFGVDEKGSRYSALDPEAYSWVHATAFVTAVAIHPLITGAEMTAAEQDRLYGEILKLGDILQVPRKMMPDTVSDYWDYYHSIVEDRLERTKVAVELLQMTLAPPLPGPSSVQRLLWPQRRLIGHALYLLLGGGMTADAREKLELRWTALHETQLRAMMSLVRPVHARLPERLRYLPLAYHARRHARELDGIRARAMPI